MQVRLKTGLKAGEVVEVEDAVGQAFLISGKADLVEILAVEHAEAQETPEKPAARRRRATPQPETR